MTPVEKARASGDQVQRRAATTRALASSIGSACPHTHYDWETGYRVVVKTYVPPDDGISIRIDVTLSHIEPEIMELRKYALTLTDATRSLVDCIQRESQQD